MSRKYAERKRMARVAQARSGMTTYSSIAALTLHAAFAFAAGQRPPRAAPSHMEVSSSAGTFRIERLETLESRWGVAALRDGRVLVTEKPGRLRIWANRALSEPVQGTPTVVHLKT